jgi:hypothetical protein
MENLTKSTGAKAINSLDDIDAKLENEAVLRNPNSQDNGSEIQEVEYPFYPELLIDSLPQCIRIPASLLDGDQDKTVFAFAALIALSAIMPNVYFIYAYKKNWLNLYGYVLGNAASGKGIAENAKELVYPIHRQKFNEHRQLLADWEQKGENKGTKPMQSTLLIPCNTTKAALIDTFIGSNGSGLMIDTETDALNTALKSKNGEFSDILRKTFHHETVTAQTKMNGLKEIHRPKLSIFLTSTQSQLHTLSHEAQNGLLSRFLYLAIPPNRKLKKVYLQNTGHSMEALERQGLRMQEMYDILNDNLSFSNGILIDIPESENDRLFAFCEDIEARVNIDFPNAADVDGAVKRFLLIGNRLAGLIAVLDMFDAKGTFDTTITVTPHQIDTVLELLKGHREYLYMIWDALETMKPSKPLKKRDANKGRNEAIKQDKQNGLSQKEISAKYNLAESAISMILNGQR